MCTESNATPDGGPQVPASDMKAAWLGTELPHRTDWHHELTHGEIDECIAAAKLCSQVDAAPSLEQIASCMPSVSARLGQIRSDLESESGACLLKGFPIEQIEQTVREHLFVAVMSLLGTPVAQTFEGATLFHVRDEGFDRNDPRARGPSSANRLTFHSDRCDVIAFLCIRDAKSGGESEVASSVKLFETIGRQRPDLLKVLMEPFLYKRHNIDPGNEHAFYEQPVFSIYQERFASSLLRVLIDRAYAETETPGMTDAQREALDLVESLARMPEMHHSFRQQPGDILLLNNFVTLHRRTAFEDYEDQERKRHLLRLWLAMPNSRPLDPVYAASYGDTAAGAIRGGMRSS